LLSATSGRAVNHCAILMCISHLEVFRIYKRRPHPEIKVFNVASRCLQKQSFSFGDERVAPERDVFHDSLVA